MSKRLCIIASFILFFILLALFYFEYHYPEAASEFIYGIFIPEQSGHVEPEIKAAPQEEVYSKRYTRIGDGNYVPRPNVETFLFIGTDKEGELEDVEDKDGEEVVHSDVLLLLVINKEEDTYATIPINRNTMMDLRYGEPDGEEIATTREQAAFAYSVGYSREQSCECAAKAVSEYLYGIHIDHYMALSMGAIPILNHGVGGVYIRVGEDFAAMEPSLKAGETALLTDEQAVAFVRGRTGVGDGTNESRMERQKIFLDAWARKLLEVARDDEQAVLRLYEDLGDCMYTNILKSDISRVVKAYVQNESLGAFDISGSVSEGDFGWAVFEADEESKAQVAKALLFDEE